jgi:dTDP-4-amino-4,6-dideoxygalactose transaminase
MGTFSFQETKTIATGEGGMVVTNDENLAERARLIRNHGEAFVKGKPRSYLSNILGWNYRMTELEASIGIEQLKKLDKINEIRIKNSEYLSKKLSKFSFIKPQSAAPYVKHVYSVYGTTYDNKVLGISRDKFTEALICEGIPVLNGYPHPLYMNPLFMEKIVYGKNGCPFTCKFYGKEINYRAGLCKNAERLCNSSIWTYSIRPPATMNDMDDVVAAIEKICDNVNELKNK